jgi:hypothetical protein
MSGGALSDMHPLTIACHEPKAPPAQAESPDQHVISGAEQTASVTLQLQGSHLCWTVGGSAVSFCGISPSGHEGFGPPSGDTRTNESFSQPTGIGSTQTEPSPHGFMPVPVDELLELLLLVAEPLALPELVDELLSLPPPLADELLAPPPPALVSSNVNGAGTHAATATVAPSDAMAKRLA